MARPLLCLATLLLLRVSPFITQAHGKRGLYQKVTGAVSVHPSWSFQSSIYEVNLRQYTPEGSFQAFEKSLPRLREMGVGILWFMPINPIGVEGRKNGPNDLGSYYSVSDYYGVNPEFGNMQQWKALVKKAQAMGFRVILDWVPNHSSPDNRWIQSHPDFYKKDSVGRPLIPYDWTDTRKLDYDNSVLRDSMIAAMTFWVRESGIDGFRCDVAGDVPDDFWKEAIGSLRKIKPLFMLAEGDKPSLHEDGFDATYPWSVMNVAYGIFSGKSTVRQLDSVIRYNDSIYPANAFRMYYTTNHDENSWNGTEFERFGDAYKTFAVWAFTMDKSVPVIYSGQEEPNRKRLKFFVKDNIQWGAYQMAPFYTQLDHLRHSTPALAADASFGRLTTGEDRTVFAYLREKNGKKLVVILNLSAKAQQVTITDKRITGTAKNVFSGQTKKWKTGDLVNLAAWGYLVFDYNTGQ
jgi:alpha-amylase